MERITYRLTLDTHKNGVQKILQGFQTADNISRRVVVSLASGSNTIDVDSNDTVAMMYVTTPNATEPSINACAIENNTIIYDVLPIVEEGITELQIKLVTTSPNGADRVLACPKFAVEVTESGLDDSGAEQTTTFTALEQAVAQANGVYNSRLIRVDVDDDCTFRAYFADGTVYETNSFNVALGNYTSSAKEYADNASLSELNAKLSETNAKLSEENAKVYEELAKKYMESASILTPEAYAKVTEDVDALEEGFEELSGNVASLTQEHRQVAEEVSSLDIKTTNLWELAKSEAGGYRFLGMSGKSVQKTMAGKNLINIDATSTTLNGVTFTVNNDGSITANGTADGNANFMFCNNIVLENGVSYILSGCPSGGGNSSYMIANNTGSFMDTGTSRTFSVEDTITDKLRIRITSGYTCNNVTFYPMVRKAEFTDATYEPYCGGTPSPNPDYPQSINNVGDCVEMMQGAYGTTNGVYGANAQYICSKNGIPCKSGDVITVTGENVEKAHVIFYNENGFVSALSATNTSATTPSGATSFRINVFNTNGITPDTVGKISLTINGKSVVQIVENGKNLAKTTLTTQTKNGVTFTVNDDGTITVNGTATASAEVKLTDFFTPTNGELKLSGCPSGGSTSTYQLSAFYGGGQKAFAYDYGVTGRNTFNAETMTNIALYFTIRSGVTVNNLVVKPMLSTDANATYDDYEPYKEKVATVLLEAPLRETDVMSNKEVVRKRATKLINGVGGVTDITNLGNVLRFRVAYDVGKIAVNLGESMCDSLPRLVNYTSDTEHHYVGTNAIMLFINASRFSSADVTGIVEYLTNNPITVEYELATPTIETLDADSQIALNSLETFDGVTYINVDSRTLPSEVKGEYGTSKVGAGVLKALNDSDTQAIKAKEFITVGTEELEVGVAKLPTGSIYIMYE